MKCHSKSAAIHANVGRQKAPEHMALAGVAPVSNVTKTLEMSFIVVHGFGEWVPSSEPAVARSPCPSEAGWRATDERQRRYPTVPLLVRSGASVRWPGLPADTLSPPATWRTSYTGSAGQRPRSLSSSTQCLSLMFQRCASSVQICGPNAKPFRP